jgi:hypothetical protein
MRAFDMASRSPFSFLEKIAWLSLNKLFFKSGHKKKIMKKYQLGDYMAGLVFFSLAMRQRYQLIRYQLFYLL